MDGLYSRVSTTDFPLFFIENEEPTLLGQNPSETDKDESAAIFDDDNDDFLIDEDVVDLRSFSPVGPIINIELLELHLQPKQTDGWIIQQSKYYRFSIIFH